MNIKSFRDLRVWRHGKELVVQIYKLTSEFPGEERYGITSQVRRAAISVPANIAEGFNRRHSREFNRFLGIALGSCGELDTLMELAFDLGYIDNNQRADLCELIDHEGRMLRTLMQGINKPESRSTSHQPRATSHE